MLKVVVFKSSIDIINLLYIFRCFLFYTTMVIVFAAYITLC